MPSRRRLASIAVVAPGKFLERSADHFLGSAVGVAIGGIEVVDSGVDRLTYQRTRLFFREGPWVVAAFGNAESHAAQAEFGNLEAGVAEILVFHVSVNPIVLEAVRQPKASLAAWSRTSVGQLPTSSLNRSRSFANNAREASSKFARLPAMADMK